MGGEASIEGDVYSYRVLMLEMFTGRMPTDDMFKDGPNLHNFVKMVLRYKFSGLNFISPLTKILTIPQLGQKITLSPHKAQHHLGCGQKESPNSLKSHYDVANPNSLKSHYDVANSKSH